MMIIIASSNAVSSSEGRCQSSAQLLTNGCLSVSFSVLGYLSIFVLGLLFLLFVFLLSCRKLRGGTWQLFNSVQEPGEGDELGERGEPPAPL